MCTPPNSPCLIEQRLRSERGAVVAEVLYALSIFCVLSLSTVGSPSLEKVLYTSLSPDMHLVLYAGGAGTPSVLARLNLPTMSRTDPEQKDQSVVVTVPAVSAGAINAPLAPGGTYSVQLGPHLRVCCDGGDNACANLDPAAPVEEASLAPAIDSPLKFESAFRELKFNLASFESPDGLVLNPAASADNGLAVKATRVANFDAVLQAGAGGSVVCRLQQGEAILATGLLRLDAPIDEQGLGSRLRGGSAHLKYLIPAAVRPGQSAP